MTVQGKCANGFEHVLDVFEAGTSDLGDGGGAFAAYVGTEKVADLWWGPGWSEDTLGVLFSTTKGLVACCAQILYDRGRLDPEAPMSDYWDGFRPGITVRHVLTHTAGLLGVPGHAGFMEWDGTGWDDYERIEDCIATSEPCWEPGTEIGYHALTYGWLVGGLVRRITGKTVGTFFADEIARPLGLDAYIATPEAHRGRVAPVITEDMTKLPAELQPMIQMYLEALRDPSTLAGKAFLADSRTSFLENLDTFVRSPKFLSFELPAGNGTATARSLAKVYAMLACGGEIEGVRIVSKESVEVFGAEQVRGNQISFPAETSRGFGYMRNLGGPAFPAPFGPNPDAFGHDGAGGQVGCCDPEKEIAIGFVRNHMTSVPKLSNQLIEAVYACV